MSIKYIFLIAFFVGSLQLAAQRKRQLINQNWMYSVTDDYHSFLPGHITDKWKQVHLPHDASVGRSFNKEAGGNNGYLPRSKGWYRKQFVVNANERNFKTLVEFEGVYMAAEVWINGQYLGKHLNGYTGFEYDLSNHLNYGGNNVLAVRYDNTYKASSRWYTGEGIYRNVWLTTVAPVHVPVHGVYVTTANALSNVAWVNCETAVINQSQQGRQVQVISSVVDPAGNIVATATAVVPVGMQQQYTYKQQLAVSQPQLWSVNKPSMYTLVTEVRTGDQLYDRVETLFGIRDVQFTPGEGFLLNGKKVFLKGGNLHHDLGPLGAAALERGYEKRLEALKAMGCNSVRLSHNPHAPVLLNLCDKMGILVFNEAYDKWTSQYNGGQAAFADTWMDDLTQFIKRDRNHPSVFIWSVGNEMLKQQGIWDDTFETVQDASDYGVAVLQKLVKLVRQTDASRAVTCALFPARKNFVREWVTPELYYQSEPAEMSFFTDVVSGNYMENMFAEDHKKYPQLIFIASEVGTNLGFTNRTMPWNEIDTSYVAGIYFWSACDYLGEAGWPAKTWGRSFFDIAEEKTPMGYYYQSLFSAKPMVQLAVYENDVQLLEQWNKANPNKRWSWYPMVFHWNELKNKNVKVVAFTNAQQVELFINNKSAGVKKLADAPNGIIEWEVPYAAGSVKAVASNNGVEVATSQLQTAGKALAIRLQADHTKLTANGMDVSYISVQLVDKDGNVVPNADRQVRFSIEGNATIAAVANGNNQSDELWVDDKRNTWQGKCLVVLRSAVNKGVVNLTATADGLAPATLTINMVD